MGRFGEKGGSLWLYEARRWTDLRVRRFGGKGGRRRGRKEVDAAEALGGFGTYAHVVGDPAKEGVAVDLEEAFPSADQEAFVDDALALLGVEVADGTERKIFASQRDLVESFGFFEKIFMEVSGKGRIVGFVVAGELLPIGGVDRGVSRDRGENRKTADGRKVRFRQKIHGVHMERIGTELE